MYIVLSRIVIVIVIVIIVVLRQHRCKINHNRIFLPPRYPPIGNCAPTSLATHILFLLSFSRHRVNEYAKKY